MKNVEVITFSQRGNEFVSRLKDFLELLDAPSQKFFRYFVNREIPRCLGNHIFNALFVDIETDLSIAYGHLDYCSDTKRMWLGICVSPLYQRLGYGHIMMEQLTYYADKCKIERVCLAVSGANPSAIKLFDDFDFKPHADFKVPKHIYMVREGAVI